MLGILFACWVGPLRFRVRQADYCVLGLGLGRTHVKAPRFLDEAQNASRSEKRVPSA